MASSSNCAVCKRTIYQVVGYTKNNMGNIVPVVYDTMCIVCRGEFNLAVNVMGRNETQVKRELAEKYKPKPRHKPRPWRYA